MAIITETKRLIIREMNLDDFEPFKKVLSDPIICNIIQNNRTIMVF